MFTFLKIEPQVIYNFLTSLMLELIFDREGIPLVDFLISQYDFGLGGGGGGERVLHPPHQGELCIQYISKSIIYINKHTEWVRQPSKKYLVCIT